MSQTHIPIKAVFTPEHAKLASQEAGKPYLPSNGTEGACFQEAWCCRCSRDAVMSGRVSMEESDGEGLCEILGNSYIDEVPEWIYGEDGYPKCTAFSPLDDPSPVADDRTLPLFD
ncbi:hypothetical protein [Caldimonas sp. KR1-144]|uniref:hypothetical protein n=1 Tax=Caldimonas sp. KR1-144 TaxID=3400911 RepID=UPI003C08F20E